MEPRKNDGNLRQLQVSLNEAMRAALGVFRQDRISIQELHKRCQVKSIQETFTHKLGKASFEYFHQEGGWKYLEPQEHVFSRTRNTRATNQGLLQMNRNGGDLIHKAAKIWNRMPQKMRELPRHSFMIKLKDWVKYD